MPTVTNSGYTAALTVDDANYDYTNVEGYNAETHTVTRTVTLTVNAASYNVTITSGSNMTKTTDSGAESQTGLSGAMTDVVYTANDGYYFPEDYSVAAVNGISVTRNSYTQITVSGTPTADAAITLTAPTAKTKPDAPTTAAAVDCMTTDNNDGKLTGVTTEMEYKKSDAESWTAGTGSDITGDDSPRDRPAGLSPFLICTLCVCWERKLTEESALAAGNDVLCPEESALEAGADVP